MTLACTESCPPGWVLNEHYCYLVTKFHLYLFCHYIKIKNLFWGIYDGYMPQKYYDEICGQNNSHLVSIHNAQENDFVTSNQRSLN